MIDTKHFTIGLAFQRSCLVQRIGNGNQVLAFVVAVVGAFARTVLEALDLRVGIPPQILGLEVGIDDRVRQAVIAVEIPGLVTQRVNLGNQVAFFVVTSLSDAAVGEAGFGDPRAWIRTLLRSGGSEATEVKLAAVSNQNVKEPYTINIFSSQVSLVTKAT
ncbi:hypothetical protein [Pseudomonas inefficax]|uniref:hypothetical protein n=1 Tax=Pseudomonas inefficax TaxID=2078786 RepID=UPI0040468BE4